MREVIVNCVKTPADYVALYDDGNRATLYAEMPSDRAVMVILDRAGAAALRDWLDAWLGKEGTDGAGD